MKPGIILLTTGIVLLSATGLQAQIATRNVDKVEVSTAVQDQVEAKNHMNFFIISKPKKLLDPPSRFNILRAKFKSMLHPKKFSCIVAGSAQEMSRKVEYRLKKQHATIGSLWFDSHGCYAKGYSLFWVGEDEYNCISITECEMREPLERLSSYVDSNTRVGIGSCYGGATYSKPGDSCTEEQRMNGDSLMKKLGTILPKATIYACESWVMTKPGLFREKFAMAGFPLRKKFKDISFEPVWSKIGMWNSYQASNDEIRSVNCVTLNRHGNIEIRYNSYQSLKKVQKKLARNKKKLRPNMLEV